MNKKLLKLLVINLLAMQTLALTASAQTVTPVNAKIPTHKTQMQHKTVTSKLSPIPLSQEMVLSKQKPTSSSIPSTKVPKTISVKSIQPIKKISNTYNPTIKVTPAVNINHAPAKVQPTQSKPAVNKNVPAKSFQPLNKVNTSLTSINYNVVKIVEGKVQDNFLNLVSTLNQKGYKIEQINSDYGYIIFHTTANYRYVAVVTNAGTNKTAIKITNIDKRNDLLQSDFSNLFN